MGGAVDTVRSSAARRRGRSRRRPRSNGAGLGLRFAFYGRISTADFRDAVSSSRWQREVACETVADRGVIVAEFFDEGCSRRVPWEERPAAAELLAAARSPERGFDAVVGEYERAFYGGQFQSVSAILRGCGVEVWLPETSGPVDLGDATHQALMLLLGAQSQREVVRARHRVLAAMRAQTCVQGRFLGGRPPYGYRLVDGGPHPNRSHAHWGRRVHRLAPDPVTAVWVRWIFEQRATGRSAASIARELNDRGVPCPSGADRERNAHRSGVAWIVRTVLSIVENPRYTGRQVWERSTTNRRAVVQCAAGMGLPEWAVAQGWAVSDSVVHPPLVTDGLFLSVQGMRAARPTKDGVARRYLLAGLVRCGLCGRRLDSAWVHGRPAYRCRHGHSTARMRPKDLAKNVYVRQDCLLERLRGHLKIGDVTDVVVVEHFRSQDLVITCTHTTWALEREKQPLVLAHDAAGQLALPVA